MPNSIVIRQCLRKEPTTREDQLLLKLKELGLLPGLEKPMVQLPKAPGVFSLGPERIPMQVPNNEVEQPVSFDIKKLKCLKHHMKHYMKHNHGHHRLPDNRDIF